MKRLIVAAMIACASFGHAASPLLVDLQLVEEDLITFDPITFTIGPMTDVYHVVMSNPNPEPVDLTPFIVIVGNYFKGASTSDFRESTDDFPRVGPNITAGSWFVAPEGTTVEGGTCICLPSATLRTDDTSNRLVGDEYLPAFGSSTIAVLSAPANTINVLDSVEGQATVGGETVGYVLVPEPSGSVLFLLAIGLLGGTRSRGR